MKNYTEMNAVQFKEAFTAALTEASHEQIKESLLVRVNRIRNGKIQRNVKTIDNKVAPNLKLVGGEVKRMTGEERRHRSLSQKIASIKRSGKTAKANRKRAATLIKRARIFGS